VNATTGTLATEGAVTLRAFVDGSVLEVMANDVTAITVRVYSVPSSPLLMEVSDLEVLESIDVWGIRPISKDRLTSD
jgi:Glycosyl hydrolases family 32 C terminal